MATSTREQLLADQVSAVLHRQLGLAGITATVSGRTVRLAGEVAHAGERRRAIEAAKELAPGHRIDDRLTISPQGAERDEALQLAAMHILDEHDEMADQQMAVVVEGGVARLVGMVTRPQLVAEAVALIRQVPGIAGVETDDLQSAAPTPAADSLASRLESALALDSRIDATSLAVSVTNGIAHLSGAVRTPSERAAALEVAAAHPGIRQVIARVTVAGSDPSEDELLAGAMLDKLPPGCQTWVVDGTAYLVGTLSPEDQQLAEAVALAAVPKVVSLIQSRPQA